MSCQRGNAKKAGPPKYKNRTAFKNDLHDTSKTTKLLNTLVIEGVCRRCKDILSWKIKFKKYKVQGQPSKCVKCSQKAVKRSYCTVCEKCATTLNMCQKCTKTLDDADAGDGDAPPPQSNIAEVAKKLGEVEVADDEASAAPLAHCEVLHCSKNSENGKNESVNSDEDEEPGNDSCDDGEDYDSDDSGDDVDNGDA